jgi:nucleoside phosphorylase
MATPPAPTPGYCHETVVGHGGGGVSELRVGGAVVASATLVEPMVTPTDDDKIINTNAHDRMAADVGRARLWFIGLASTLVASRVKKTRCEHDRASGDHSNSRARRTSLVVRENQGKMVPMISTSPLVVVLS